MRSLALVKNSIFLFCLGTTHAWADTPISSLPITLSTPGSYYLTDNLTSTGSYGILISAPDVTVDLKGYTITGTNAANSNGVWISSAAHNAIVKNGTIKEFEDGVDALSGNFFVTIKNVSVRNTTWGIKLDSMSALVENCTSAENMFGIAAANGTILNNLVLNNTSTGIYAGGNGARIIGNKVSYNGSEGIKVGNGGTVMNNTSSYNDGDGIKCFISECNITGNTALNNQGDGIDSGVRSLVKDNVAKANTAYGISVGPNSYSLYDGNVRSQNGYDPSFSLCDTCSLGVNLPQ